MTRVRTLSDLRPGELEGRAVLVRADYNVPLDSAGGIFDSTRIDATLPTLEELGAAGARTVIVSHLGRPGGAPDPTMSLDSVAHALSSRLGQEVQLIDTAPQALQTASEIGHLAAGGTALLENIRFHPGETRNDPVLARALGSLADAFVSDAFGVAHRAHASNVGAALEIRGRGGVCVAGSLMARELHHLGKLLDAPARPFVTIMGGAKISGKLELIRAILPRVDRLLIGGAMANTFFRALGLSTGESLVEEDLVVTARELLEEAGDRLLLPVDCIVAARLEPDARPVTLDRGQVGSDQRIGDIGPRSVALFARELQRAATVLWNGPLGVFEMEPFSTGTLGTAKVLADACDAGAVVVLGGGDSAAAARAAGVVDRMTHVSTGGGAALDLLAGHELPGVAVLERIDT